MPRAADDPAWLRTQHTIRKLLLNTGTDSLVYATSALENEVTAPEGLKTSWENAREFLEEYDAKPGWTGVRRAER